MFLDSNRKLIAVLAAAKTTLNLPVGVDYVDITATATTPGPYNAYTNGTIPVDILPAPAVSTTRKINGLSIYGRDTAPSGVQVYLVDATPATGAITAGAFVVGNTYQITAVGTTDFTLIGASANTVGALFTATGVGAGTGTASTAYQQIDMNIQIDDTLGYTDTSGWYVRDLNGSQRTTQFGGSPLIWTSGADLVLGIGQSAKITAVNATSIPLHVACGDGQIYEMEMAGTYVGAAGASASYLYPNNFGYSNAFTHDYHLDIFTAGTSSLSAITESFISLDTGQGTSIQSGNFLIFTSTANKKLLGNSYGATSTAECGMRSYVRWNDTTTVWSSVGTVIMPNAWTGVINVRRVL